MDFYLSTLVQLLSEQGCLTILKVFPPDYIFSCTKILSNLHSLCKGAKSLLPLVIHTFAHTFPHVIARTFLQLHIYAYVQKCAYIQTVYLVPLTLQTLCRSRRIYAAHNVQQKLLSGESPPTAFLTGTITYLLLW